MGRKDTGKNFENEIRRSLKACDCWWFRIQDTNDVSRFVKQAVAEKQPADFMAVYRSRPVLLECKTTRNLTSFPLYYGATRSIPSHQIKLARQAQQHGALAFILISIKLIRICCQLVGQPENSTSVVDPH